MADEPRRRDWRDAIFVIIPIAAVLSLVWWPMPARLVVGCIAWGLIAGALIFTRLSLLVVLSLAMMAFTPEVAERLVPLWPTAKWQPLLIVGGVALGTAALRAVGNPMRRRSATDRG